MIEILIFIICLTQRSILALIHSTDFDTYGHLYFAKKIREQKSGPFNAIKTDVVGSDYFYHHNLIYWIYGIFGIPLLLRLHKFINPVLDSIFACIIYVFFRHIGISENASLCSTLLYILMPFTFSRLSTGPRIGSLTPRLISEIIMNLIIILLFIKEDVQILLYFGSIITFVFILITGSKFGTQVVCFMLIPIAFIVSEYLVLLLVGIAFLFAVLISKGKFIFVLRNHFKHLVWYFKKNIKKNVAISSRNDPKLIFHSIKKRQFKKLFMNLVSLNSYTSLLIKFPLILVLGYFHLDTSIYIEHVNNYMLFIAYLSLIIYFIINIRYFLFLGEADRYISHVIICFLYMYSIFIDYNDSYFLTNVLLTFGIIFYCFEIIYFFLRDKDNTYEEFSKKIINYIHKLDNSPTVAAYPYHAVGVFRLMLETNCKTVFQFTTGKVFRHKYDNEFADDYPYFKLKYLDELSKILEVDYFICDMRHVKERIGINWEPSKSWKLVMSDVKHLSLYKKIS